MDPIKQALDDQRDRALQHYGEMARQAVDAKDAARYRWLRSEDVATDPRYYTFWNEFNVKLCREGKMDALIDDAMRGVLPQGDDEPEDQ